MIITKMALYFQWLAMITSTITYITNKRKVDNEFKLKSIGIYCIMAFLFCSLSIINTFGVISFQQTLRIHRFSILLHFGLLSSFFLNIIEINRIRTILIIIIILITPILIITIFKSIIHDESFYTIVISNIFLIFFSISYFVQLFYIIPQTSILKDPNFWVTCGIFISMGMSIPNNMMENYLTHYIKDNDFFVFTNIFGKTAYGIMHLFFIKAFLCSQNKN